MKTMNVWVVIPAYNEAHSLENILRAARAEGFSTLVVDDGSKDDTFDIAKKEATVVIRNSENFGKGSSLNTGFDYLLNHTNFDYVITMDGDGQHSPQDLQKFIKEAAEGADFVVGNRMSVPLHMPAIRVVTNRFMSWLLSKIVGQKIPDTQCGFRLIKKEVLQQIKITTSKFEIESELLIKAVRQGVSIKSVSIQSIYFEEIHSKIRPFIDTMRFIRFLFQSNE